VRGAATCRIQAKLPLWICKSVAWSKANPSGSHSPADGIYANGVRRLEIRPQLLSWQLAAPHPVISF
jgi:hypothetical protein